MRLLVILPTQVLIDEVVEKVVAEAENGEFCLLPKHRDFATAIVPGIVTFTDDRRATRYVATAEGMLVKSEDDIRVATRSAVLGDDLGSLRRLAAERFIVLDDRERVARSAMAKLEADFVRRFIEFGEPRGERI